MEAGKRPFAFWLIIIVLAISIPLLLMGQTSAIFAYDRAVELGLQESVEEVTEFGVQTNRAFGFADTVGYIPFIILSLYGLLARKRWALITTGAVMGVSIYWTAAMSSLMFFAQDVPGFSLNPGIEYAIFVGGYFVFGVWGLLYLLFRSDKLLA